MSNMGFYKALEENGMTSVKTAVGDRYVVEEMRKNDYNLGGEQSGHIIFLDYNTTGDGMLTAIQLVNIMKETGKRLSELAAEMTIFPQRLVNIRVTDKHAVTENAKVARSNCRSGRRNWKQWSSISSSFWNRATCTSNGGSNDGRRM